MDFKTKLENITRKNNSLVCVGLDSDFAKIPESVKETEGEVDDIIFAFNKAIIDATDDLVCAYKPNSAFYEAQGIDGISALKKTVHYLQDTYPEIIIILDAKRADIGNTNEGYVKFAYDFLGVDAVTLHPYLGKEALKPFLDRGDKGAIILCRTSNPGAGEIQDLNVGSKPIYQLIAEKIAKDWNSNGNCGLVVGATYPSELEIVRHIVGDMPILIPGIGVQGGDVEKTIRAGKDDQGLNAIINSSRAVIFASDKSDFSQKARHQTELLKDQINLFR